MSSEVTGKAFDWKLFKQVFSYTKPYRSKLILAMIFILSLAAIAPLKPWLIEHTVDHYITTPDKEMLWKMTMLMVGLLLLEGVLQFLDTYYTTWLGQRVILDIRTDLYKHIVNLRLKYFDHTPIGMLVTRTVSDIETIADIFAEGILVIIGDVLKLVIIVAIMFYNNVSLTLISLLTIPLLLISANIFKNAVKSAFQEVRTQVARLNTFVQEHITGINIVQIFNREEAEYEKFKTINQKHTDANIRSVWHYSVFFPVVELLSAISLGLVVWWGGRSVLQGHTTPGEIISFIIYINMLFRPIRQLADRFNTLQMGMVGSERVFKLMNTFDVIEDKGVLETEKVKGEVEFKNMWFAYNDENWVLKDVSFKVNPGECVAIVGATGAGKSSIVNLLLRFYEYNKGEILLDGKNIRDYKLENLRTNMGMVLQEVFLFSDTVKNNITLHNENISEEQVIEASKLIGAHDFISKLPGGYDYNVMERGGTLSAGQRQLISFIRAYVYDPQVLVLDEATSSIDSESELLVQKAIDKLTEDRTSIIIAHRLSTIQKADRILVLDKGVLVESGSHQELLKHNGVYKRLFELQYKEDVVSG